MLGDSHPVGLISKGWALAAERIDGGKAEAKLRELITR